MSEIKEITILCNKKVCNNLVTNSSNHSTVCSICGNKIIKDGKLTIDPKDLPTDEEYEKYKDIVLKL